MIGNLLQLPPGARPTATQKRKLRALRRARFLETGIYEPAGTLRKGCLFTRPQIVEAFDDAKNDHRPVRIPHHEQKRHAAPAPLHDHATARQHRDAQRAD